MNKISKNKISFLTSLSQKKFRQKNRKIIIEGYRIIEEALKSPYGIDSLIYEIGAGKKYKKIIETCRKNNIEILQGKAQELKKISNLKTSPGICAVVNLPKKELNIKKIMNSGLLLGVNNIKDPGNLGTIIRTAEWFGVNALIMDPGCCELYSPKVVKSAMGSLFHMDIFENIDLVHIIDKLKRYDFKILSTAAAGENLKKVNLDSLKKFVIIGSEADGINKTILNKSDYMIKIPGTGKVESLNAAVSCGIIIWELIKG